MRILLQIVFLLLLTEGSRQTIFAAGSIPNYIQILHEKGINPALLTLESQRMEEIFSYPDGSGVAVIARFVLFYRGDWVFTASAMVGEGSTLGFGIGDPLVSLQMRNKGIGSFGYLMVTDYMHRNYGRTLYSDSLLTPDSQRVWKRFIEQGMATFEGDCSKILSGVFKNASLRTQLDQIRTREIPGLPPKVNVLTIQPSRPFHIP